MIHICSFGGGLLKKSPETELFDTAFSENSSNEHLLSDIESKYDPNWPIRIKLRFARTIINYGYREFARSICKSVINTNPDSSLSYYALDILWEMSSRNPSDFSHEFDLFTSYLDSLSMNRGQEDVYAYAELILAGFEKETGITRINNIAKSKSGTVIGELALFQKFMFYLLEMEDTPTALKVLNDLKDAYPKSQSTLEAISLFEDFSGSSTIFKPANESIRLSSIPATYKLQGGFPNPFNPITTIKYTLPYNSQIQLAIYNILGQRVSLYVLKSQAPGNHIFTWNGKNQTNADLPSGLYFVRFRATSLEGNNEAFDKSIKVTLLR